MSNVKKLMMTAAAGGDALNVEDVFSTYVYTGNGSSQTIDNDIALADGVGGGTSTKFSGIEDFLQRGTTFTNNTNSKTLTLSFWFRWDDGPNENERIFGFFGDSTGTNVNAGLAGYIDTSAKSLKITHGNQALNWDTGNNTITKGKWTHFLMSLDMDSQSNTKFYLDDVAITGSYNYFSSGTAVKWDTAFNTIGAFWNDNYGQTYAGKLAHFYVDYTWRDLATTSNRRIFINANGGSTSASSLAANNPIIYFPMTDDYSLGENAGTGGDLTTTGGSPTIVEDGTEYLSNYGEGGLVWIKSRNGSNQYPWIFDTERGATKLLNTSTNWAEGTTTNSLTQFNSDGFSVGSYDDVNKNAEKFASWTFRKAPKFFDIITATSTGSSSRVLSHNLGCDVGFAVVKDRDQASNWISRHRSLTSGQNINLNTTQAAFTFSGIVSFDSTTITINEANFLGTGRDYIIYLFAHNDGDGEFGPTGDQDIIKCGSYTGNGSSTGPEIDLGWEPQYLMVKRADGTGPWYCVDNMRGFDRYRDNAYLYLNESNSEFSDYELFRLHPNGFQPRQNFGVINASGGSYIYMAIRRGAMGIPTNADDVFSTGLLANTSTVTNTGIVTDMYIHKAYGNESWFLGDRFSGRTLQPNQQGAQFNSTNEFDHQHGFKQFQTNSESVYWAWKRAAGFFDVLVYTGNQINPRTLNHNLGVVPEMIWHKCRTGYSSGDWHIWHKDTHPAAGTWTSAPSGTHTFNQAYSNLNSVPTATTVEIKNIGYDSQGSNYSGYTYAMFFFASVDGVCKVGSYTGNSSTQTIDCGFTNGARFVMIKSSTVSNTDWMIFDTNRGIVAGNDPVLEINKTTANTITTDWVDPHSSGFIVNALGDVNSNGETYIFYAIA